MDVEQVGDRQGGAGEHGVHDVERERDEHERELQRFGDAGEKRGQPGRRKNAEGHLLLADVRHMDHRQRRGRQTEHQDRVEAGGEPSGRRVAGGEAAQFTSDHTAVGSREAAVDEPDVGVENVM